jgi:hypothetical protein
VQGEHGEAVDGKTESEEDRCAPGRTRDDQRLPFPTGKFAVDREDARDTDHEEEAGEHNIG